MAKDPVLKAKLRKAFHKRIGISIGDLVIGEDGTFGEYWGISTHKSERPNITVLLYKTNVSSERAGVKHLPKSIKGADGKDYPLVYEVSERPQY